MTTRDTNDTPNHRTGEATHERDPVASLRRELAWLKRQIRDNERIWSCFRDIEIRLIGAEAPAEVASLLAVELPRLFPRVTAVSLACSEDHHDLRRLLDDAPGHCVALTSEQLATLFVPPYRPRLGPCTNEEARRLFPRLSVPVGSAAMVPLVLHGHLVGSLNQASVSPEHFSPNDATDLIEHLAAVVAMCLENAVAREHLRQQGLVDPLTGVPNRRFYEQRLREEVERWAREGESLACMLVDIDHFKQINDRFGHAAGDVALRAVATSLTRGLRASDVLARYGGEEFVLLLPGTGLKEAAAIAERLREGVTQIESPGNAARGALSVSIGVACLGESDQRNGAAERLIQSADAALYRAKASGRNRVVLAPEQGSADQC